jgi:hypothetical protein
MGAVRQRLDGFYSADAPYDAESRLTTPPLTFTGRRLVLNLNTSAAGSATVAILDAGGKPLDGFAAEDCDVIMGNDVARAVSWKGNGDLSPLRGKPVRLRFAMRSTKLYAFEFPD